MPTPTRWLIGQPAAGLPEPLFLHVFEEGEAETALDYIADRTRALRFASEWDALRFAREHGIAEAEITEHRASDLVGTFAPDLDRIFAVA